MKSPEEVRKEVRMDKEERAMKEEAVYSVSHHEGP